MHYMDLVKAKRVKNSDPGTCSHPLYKTHKSNDNKNKALTCIVYTKRKDTLIGNNIMTDNNVQDFPSECSSGRSCFHHQLIGIQIVTMVQDVNEHQIPRLQDVNKNAQSQKK